MEEKIGFDFAIFLAGATSIVLLLATAILILFYISRRKVQLKDSKMKQLEFDHQRELLDHHILATEEERKRLAMDLHDDVGTRLATLRLNISNSKPNKSEMVMAANKEIDQIIALVRNISHDLMPSSIELFGLQVAVEQLTSSLNKSNRIKFSSQFHDQPDLPSKTSLAIYRIVQELMHNSSKHSQARSGSFEFKSVEKGVLMKYHDDGVGISTQELKGIGIRSIKNRVRMIHGEIQWDIAQNDGFAMELFIPTNEQ